ncbi:group-specific protein [Filobacillus milosensis]|uniref:Group-specific protein n=2 Tax=Filobacillus milosensis TaxID=94137 RepID=A0A4Y8IDF0_9BACI|nr:group-specific protein [Filobacillus milosensis]
MQGNDLIPLNKIKNEYPNLYEKYTKKYQGERENLLKRKIPKLDCLWNDVVHFLPLHPYHVFNELDNLGIEVKKDLHFFKIPAYKLNKKSSALYHYRPENWNGPGQHIYDEEISIIEHIEDFKELTSIPKETVNYYKEENQKGNKFGLFHFIPHLLIKEGLSIDNAVKVSWSNKPS